MACAEVATAKAKAPKAINLRHFFMLLSFGLKLATPIGRRQLVAVSAGGGNRRVWVAAKGDWPTTLLSRRG